MPKPTGRRGTTDRSRAAFGAAAALLAALAFAGPAVQLLRDAAHGGDGWRTGDWLISYAGGFHRRGLPGELAFRLSAWTGLGPVAWATAFQLACLGVFIALALRLFLQGGRGAARLALFASPAFLLFDLRDFLGSFRKEDLLFCVFAGLLAFGDALRRRLRPAAFTAAAAAAYLAAGLSHELAALCLPFFLLLAWLWRREGGLSAGQASALAAAFGAAALLSAGLAYRHPGGAEASQAVCARLTAAGLDPTFCTGAVAALGQTAAEGHAAVLERIELGRYPLTYGLSLLLAALPFALFVRVGRRLAVGLALAAAALLPLFWMALDWGRWIRLYAALLTLLVLRFGGGEDIRVREPGNGGSRRLLWAAAALAYAYAWSIPHCCAAHIGLHGPLRRLAELVRSLV